MSLPIALISLNTLVQDRLAKMKEENKSLLDERARAEEERDDLEAQVLACGYFCVCARVVVNHAGQTSVFFHGPREASGCVDGRTRKCNWEGFGAPS